MPWTRLHFFLLFGYLTLSAAASGCNVCWPRGGQPGACPGGDDDDDASDDDNDTADDDTGSGDDDTAAGPCGSWTSTILAQPELACVPAGVFVMGSPVGEEDRYWDEEQHHVELSRPYFVGTTEVTQHQFLDVIGTEPSDCSYGCGATHPVMRVDWYGALEFCNVLSELDGLEPVYDLAADPITWNVAAVGYRLPTESEWERAARGGEISEVYAGSDTWEEVGWCDGNSDPYEARPVAQLAPNGYGLYDMSGNLWEWTWDRYGDYPEGTISNPALDPMGDEFDGFRVYRGGAFPGAPDQCRVAYRGDGSPGTLQFNFGFRIARTVGD